MAASAPHEAAITDLVSPPELKGAQESLLVNKGFGESTLALLMRFPHDSSENTRISVLTRWPGGGLGIGGAKLHTNLNESLPETINEPFRQDPLGRVLLLGPKRWLQTGSEKRSNSAITPHEETLM